ncbi:electron transfer flavoprotein subunit beta/FixA family protein [Flavobacterium sp. CS20]|jgi:electron transfer flavoprotein beta subunit|uniref:electron transfer flavoprotein subunit beta/FixA family protein n=1 Tax=Flavobacterium sp. CS20 TaxID=2775246 RepID=UPI001B39FB72|nr:electron transfer flavoprotein subunit beta/FixA family protein [Flavobacterium sp. CS20]QTY26778.1 electron transfer flavoprotein subunit beta/FixA family protein [Flavobacterium sp. CS20]
MKILVCISHVPDTTSKINFKDNDTAFDTNGVQFVIGPNEEFGLTRAMWFKEKQGASIDVVTVGEKDAEPTMRKALAIGADKAIRVDAKPVDAFQVAQEIADVAKNGDYDLIIAGRESIDYNGGMVPGMVAKMIGATFVNTCVSLEVEDQKATAIREIDGGKETLTCDLPLVVGGQKGLVEEKDLRIPNMRGIMMARKKPLEVKDPVAENSLVEFKKFSKPAPKGEIKMIDAENLDELIDLLHNEAKVI